MGEEFIVGQGTIHNNFPQKTYACENCFSFCLVCLANYDKEQYQEAGHPNIENV